MTSYDSSLATTIRKGRSLLYGGCPGPVGPAGRLSPSAQLGFADLLNTDTLHTETCWILSTDHSKMKCQLHWPCDSIAATRGVSLNVFIQFVPCKHLELVLVFHF